MSFENDKKYIVQYWNYLKKHSKLLTVGFILIPFISLLHLFQPYITKYGIDENILKNDYSGLTLTATLFAMCVIGEFISRCLQSFIFQYIGQQTIAEIRKDLFKHVLTFSSSYFDKTPLGTITSRLTTDIEALNDSFASGDVTLLSDLLTLIGIIGFMLYLSPKLTLIAILIVPPLAIISNFFRIKLRYCFNKIRTLTGKMTGMLQEQLHGVSIIQLFGRYSKNYSMFKKINSDYRKANVQSVVYDALLYSLVEAISSVAVALVLWYGWGQYNQSLVTIGLLVAFIEYIQKFFHPLKELSNKFAILQHTLAALEKIFGTFEVRDSIPKGTIPLKSLNEEINFSNVSFAYPSHEDKKILHDLNFKIKKGQTLAIVGPTGSGKTTISRILTKLYIGYTGSITVDNNEIKDIVTKDLRQLSSIVSQDVQLFSSSIKFNITLGNPSVTDEMMVSAAKKVQIHADILGHENGYDSLVQNGGQNLSAGQAQLITFARALASPAPLILLDEATASVDSQSEAKIQSALEEILTQKTVIVIAHRLSTIKKADTILAMKNGQCIEMGTHDELMAKDGYYAKLFKLQFS